MYDLLEAIIYLIIAYTILCFLYQTSRAIKGYLYRQHQRRENGTISGYSWKEIFIYGIVLLFCLFTLGAGLMLFLAHGSTDDKELS